MSKPLAEVLRPTKLADFVGQEDLVGKNGFISKLLTTTLPSLILWGPPGCGKTTLARIIANQLKREFYEFSAVNTSSKDVEKIINKSSHATNYMLHTTSPIVFVDEIHRFNKAQQDKLLPHVERGDITLIGATTENPSFEVIGPLLSRCRVVVLKQLEARDLKKIIKKATKYLKVKIAPKAQNFLIEASNGDARVVLNVLEIATNLTSHLPAGRHGHTLSTKHVEAALQKRALNFDRQGDEYYNTISALHKTIRGSDPDAALYYLARMLEAGQDPLYIARRLIRVAAEDIGLANPNALLLANAAFEACDKIGMPECNVLLAEAVVYLAKSPKSNSLYLAYGKAAADVHKYGNLPVPMHILNAPTKLMKDLGYGKGYDYTHSPAGKKKDSINYLPEKLKGKRYL